MLNISNISIHFGGNYLFKKINLTVNQRDKIGLVGKNGSGKSTLMKLIAGLEEPESGIISYPKGFTIGYLPQELQIESDKSVFEETKEALKEINYLERKVEEITAEISNRTDYETSEYMELAEQLSTIQEKLSILGSHSIDAEIEKILLGLGFVREHFSMPVNKFSGGWQMRIELAKILLRKPDCILLDEPTNHLDIESILWIENFLKNYFGAIILVSHDKRFLDNITNRTVEISLGRLYDFPASYTKYVDLRKKQKEQQFAAYKNQQKEIAEQERFIERFRYKSELASRVQSKIKQLEKMDKIEIEEEDTSSINLRFPEPPRSGRLVAETKDLTKRYGENLVLDKIDFEIERGDKIAFVGKNGEGKSTLSKILAGILDHDGVFKLGHNVERGYFAQHQAQMLDVDDTVFETIDKEAKGDMRTKVRSLLGAFLFSGEDVEKKVKVLSGGEKSRLSIAKMLLQPMNFLIMDEPTNHLDMQSKDILKDALLNFDASMVIVSHDREFLEGLTNRTVYFKNRKITEYPGDVSEFLDKFDIQEIDDINIGKVSKEGKNEKKTTEAQAHRQKTKEIQRRQNKINKQIGKIENRITEVEAEIAEYDQLFEDPEFFKKPEAENVQKKHVTLQKELNELMDKWEDLQLEVEEIKS